MKFFPRGTWGYAVLLVLLFSIAAIATMRVIDFTTERFYLPEYERAVQGFSLAIWSLTMGLMFLSGALGLLAISATAEYESRHRIARIVNTMNYLSDGLLALDYQGHVRAANPAARQMVSIHMAVGKRTAINDIFPSLSAENISCLLNRNNPCEIEVECPHVSGSRMLRLRSQPAEGLVLVFVSDITEMRATSIRQQQTAKLQLLGRIAGGVAHDFSNILSAISGHAVLIQRFSEDKRSVTDSIGVIVNETQRGVRLSRQLLVLSRSSDFDGQSSGNLAENVREAGELLRVALSAAWTIEAEANGDFPVVPFSPVQIVQIVLNLGLLAADALRKSGKLAIHLKTPENLPQDTRCFAAVITISASAEPDASGQTIPSQLQSATMGMIDTTGMIPSVVRALIEEAGGRLDELYAGNDQSLYRICLPAASKISEPDLMPMKSAVKDMLRLKSWSSSLASNNTMHPPAALRAAMWAGSIVGGLAGASPWPNLSSRPVRTQADRPWPGRQWKILLASSDAKFKQFEKALADAGATVETRAAIDSVLAAIDSERKPDVIIADKRLFGDEADSLLKAMRKICPDSGIVIISRKPEEEKLRHENGFVFLESDSEEGAWLDAVVSSKQPFLPQK